MNANIWVTADGKEPDLDYFYDEFKYAIDEELTKAGEIDILRFQMVRISFCDPSYICRMWHYSQKGKYV